MAASGAEQNSKLMSSNTPRKKDEYTGGEIDPSQYTKVVEFLLDSKHFVVDLYGVKEIVKCTGVTKLPNTPVHIHGIIDIRGQITTVIDPKKYLKIEEGKESNTGKCKIIVLDEKKTGTKVGMLVDEVVAITAYSKEDINTSIANDSSSYIKGIVEKVTHGAHEGERDKIELIVWIEASKFVEEL